MFGYDAGTIVEEILQRLYDLRGSSAHLTLSAEVSVPGGIDDTTLRIIKENAGSLGVTLRVRQGKKSQGAIYKCCCTKSRFLRFFAENGFLDKTSGFIMIAVHCVARSVKA